MNALRLLFLGPLSILCFHSTAQVEDLMRDKNITWIAEYYNDVVTEQAMEGKMPSATNFITPLKYVNITEGAASETFVLQNIVLEAVKEGQLRIYSDANCKIPITYDAICRHDSIQHINPATYEQDVKVVSGLPWLGKFSGFQIRQIIFYNAKKVQFGVRTVSIALLARWYDADNEVFRAHPWFYVKAEDLTKKRRLSDKSITWASRLNLINGVVLRSDSTKILKKIGDNMPISALFDAFKAKPKIPFYKMNDVEPNIKYSKSERSNYFIQYDTLTSIDPISYVHTYTPIATEIKAEEINQLKLIQNWYWNNKKKRLEIWLSAIAPLKKETNDMIELYYNRPLFYRRTDD